MSTVPATIDDVTPAWLTLQLRHARVLPEGAVQSVNVTQNGAFNSAVHHLELTYTPDAPATAPKNLLIKRNNDSAWGRKAQLQEVGFYRLIASLPDHPHMIVPCYGAGYDYSTTNSYLLFRDLTPSHHAPVTRDQQISIVEGVPQQLDIDRVVTALASFHAYWWEHPLLGGDTLPIHKYYKSRENYQALAAILKKEWDDLITAEQSWLPAEVRQTYDHIVSNLDNLWEDYYERRFATLQNMSLIHGDAYFSNFLCPNDPEKDDETYLLDWQSPQVYYATDDLANLCATFWAPEQRHEGEREQRVLQRYYDVLLAHGVKNYSWDDLLRDYKLAVIDWSLVPVHDRAEGSVKNYWWPKMQCLVANYHDLGCAELLKG